jgi:hypothetical protein
MTIIPVAQLQFVLGAGDGALVVTAGPAQGAIALAPAVSSTTLPYPWQANSLYPVGAQVTPLPGYGPTAPNVQNVFVCVLPGRSGMAAPMWNNADSSVTVDGQVRWFCQGFFQP